MTDNPNGYRNVLRAIKTKMLEDKASAYKDAVIKDLAMLCRMMIRRLLKLDPESSLAKRAMDYLTRHGLQGSPLKGKEDVHDR